MIDVIDGLSSPTLVTSRPQLPCASTLTPPLPFDLVTVRLAAPAP